MDDKKEIQKEETKLTRREFFDKLKTWSPVVGFMFVSSALVSSSLFHGCTYSEYNRYDVYSRYDEYCNIGYCNDCCHNYETTGVCYCNYYDYADACCT